MELHETSVLEGSKSETKRLENFDSLALSAVVFLKKTGGGHKRCQ